MFNMSLRPYTVWIVLNKRLRVISIPRSISEAFGLCEYGVPLYTASSSFSFTCVTVSQFSVFTVTSGAFSFSGFTQCRVYRGQSSNGICHI